MDDTLNTRLNGADTSLAGYASTTGLSTREPLVEKPPHPLLDPFNSLLNSLLIPISLSSLALATPTLLLTVLEALLETRIDDVPEDYRSSWERTKRTKVTEVVIQAAGEVLDDLARAKGEEYDGEWRREAVQVRGIVRGTEEELAKVVYGLIRIARGLGVDFDQSTSTSTVKRAPSVAASPSPLCQRLQRDPPKPTTSTNSLFPPSIPAPAPLFTPRPLRQTSRHPPPLSRSVSSSVSSTSSRSSRSTSLTIPHPSSRPSLFNELERSGTLSPPPRMPGSPRRNHPQQQRSQSENEKIEGKKSRSTLELMRESENRRIEIRDEGYEARRSEKESKGKGKEVDDVFSTPRNDGPIQQPSKRRPVSNSNEKKQEQKEGAQTVTTTLPVASKLEDRLKKEKVKPLVTRKKKERTQENDKALGTDVSSRPSSDDQDCCKACRADLPSKKAEEPASSDRVDSKDTPRTRQRSQYRSSQTDLKKGSRRRKEKWCRCQSIAEDDDSEDAEEEEEEEEETRSSSSTLGKSQVRTKRGVRKKKRVKDPGKKPTPALSIPTTSRPARRIRVHRLPRTEALSSSTAKNETGDLSVHGESEIERFEASHRGTASALLGSTPQTAPATPPTSTEHAPIAAASTPSPYTMLLLAQRARLAEKLRALELRERDRMAAREAEASSRDG